VKVKLSVPVTIVNIEEDGMDRKLLKMQVRNPAVVPGALAIAQGGPRGIAVEHAEEFHAAEFNG
jgi:hypothetical protein